MIFKNIALVGWADSTEIRGTLLQLIVFLEQKNYLVFCDEFLAQHLPQADLNIVPRSDLGKNCDLMIVVGGDGSVLHAAKQAARYAVPMIGINHGKLGFLTDIRHDELETRLSEVLKGKYWMGRRFFLYAHFSDGRECGTALNDFVLSPRSAPHMLEFEIFINNEFVCSHHADGLIIATPTGSTAYALSGGGPILHPTVEAMLLLTMFPHTLSNRPIVVEGESDIRIEFSSHNKMAAQLRGDGGEITSVSPGESIYIKKHKQYVKLLHPLDYSYYEGLRNKLYWGKRLTT